MASTPAATQACASSSVVTAASTGTPAGRASSTISPGSPRAALTTRAPAASAASTSAAGASAGGAAGGPGGRPSSSRKGASSACIPASSGLRRTSGGTWTLTPTGPVVSSTARRTASCTAPVVMPATPKKPRPPAELTAATSSGGVQPPAIGASRTGWWMPRRSQSGVWRGTLGRASGRHARKYPSAAGRAGASGDARPASALRAEARARWRRSTRLARRATPSAPAAARSTPSQPAASHASPGRKAPSAAAP